MNVTSVESPFPRSQTSVGIRELTLERNPLSVMNVEKLSGRSQASQSIRVPTKGRNRMNTNSTGEVSSIRPHYTQEKLHWVETI